MKRSSLTRTGSVAALALTMSLGLAACGEDDDSTATDTTSSSAPSSEAPMDTETKDAATEAGADTFGPGCSAIPADGAGSFNGMATEPVATAASANPLLTTLVAAVTEAGLGDTLNSAEAITVFAPTDDAFAAIPEADLNAVLADKELLTTVLTNHVVAGQLGPDEVAGRQETLAGTRLNVKGSGDAFTVSSGSTKSAAVLCGNVPTSNATVYVVDSVLLP